MASTTPTPTPNAKRRRLHDAAATLTKPFKSPLRRAPAPSASTPPTTTPTPQPTNPAPHPSPTLNPSSQLTRTPRKLTLPTATTTPKAPTPADPEYHTLQTIHRTLQSQLAALRTELDTLQQAHRIESSGRDDELERLIAKWRGVGQKVAEEVFVGTRERVLRMGGMRGLKERSARGWGWDEDGRGREDDDDEGGYEAHEGDGKRKTETETENEDEDEDEEEEFTMAVMLKMMGIDLKVIGFEKEGGRE